MSTANFRGEVFLALNLACFLASAEAGHICCAPKKFSLIGTVVSRFPLRGFREEGRITRHYDADAQMQMQELVKDNVTVSRHVQIGHQVFEENSAGCTMTVSPFLEDCIPDSYEDVSDKFGGASGGGRGSGDWSDVYFKVYRLRQSYAGANNSDLVVTTELHVSDDDCLLRTRRTFGKTGGRLVFDIRWDFPYERLGSVDGDPKALFRACIPTRGPGLALSLPLSSLYVCHRLWP